MSSQLTLPVDGTLRLPPGRYKAEWSDLRQHWGFNRHRADLLDKAELFVTTVGRLLPVCAAWVAGSLLTDKENPDDLDVVFVFDTDQQLDLNQRALATRPALTRVAQNMGLKVDAYGFDWQARTSNLPSPDERAALADRGYWDDWWMRERQVPKGHPASRACALPRRGYVEVIVNGYK